MTDLSDADVCARAARVLRERAWKVHVHKSDRRVALALADWLDAAQKDLDWTRTHNAAVAARGNEYDTYAMPHALVSGALAVARAVLGEDR